MNKAELLSTLERIPDDNSQYCVGFVLNGKPGFAPIDAIVALPNADGGVVLLMTQQMADAVLDEKYDKNGKLVSVGLKCGGKIVPGKIAMSDYAKDALEKHNKVQNNGRG